MTSASLPDSVIAQISAIPLASRYAAADARWQFSGLCLALSLERELRV